MEDGRCHALGNGFHIPSILLILAVMLQKAVAGVGFQPQPVAGQWAELHASRTIFADSALCRDCASNPHALMTDVLSMFPAVFPTQAYSASFSSPRSSRLEHVSILA